jgi:hypothetical protein
MAAELTVDEVYPVEGSNSRSMIRSSESLVYKETSIPILFFQNLPSIPSSNS